MAVTAASLAVLAPSAARPTPAASQPDAAAFRALLARLDPEQAARWIAREIFNLQEERPHPDAAGVLRRMAEDPVIPPAVRPHLLTWADFFASLEHPIQPDD